MKEWFDNNEANYYERAVAMIQSYIGGYEEKHRLVKVKKNEQETILRLLEDIYHDLVMRHSNRRKRATTFSVGVDLVNAGVAFLPQNFVGKT